VGYHHVARDEDADPMPVHWQGFRIVPRDVTAENPR
jgi:primary-amine oxidase